MGSAFSRQLARCLMLRKLLAWQCRGLLRGCVRSMVGVHPTTRAHDSRRSQTAGHTTLWKLQFFGRCRLSLLLTPVFTATVWSARRASSTSQSFCLYIYISCAALQLYVLSTRHTQAI